MERKEEVYKPALSGKKIPILTLDNKWHKLFTQTETTPAIEQLEKQLNELLKRQGKLNTEVKDIKRIKKKLMDELVSLRDEMEQNNYSTIEQKVEENKRLINECNEKLDACQDELLDLPKEMDQVNYELMLQTMEVCYDKLQNNTEEIVEISKWISEVRIELKKKLIRKQEKEIKNHDLYAYMHDIFGASVIEIFDLKYNPEENRPKPALKNVDVKEEPGKDAQ